jgi:hypothetical protein
MDKSTTYTIFQPVLDLYPQHTFQKKENPHDQHESIINELCSSQYMKQPEQQGITTQNAYLTT